MCEICLDQAPRLESRPCPLDSPAHFTPVGPGVLLCRLTRSLPRQWARWAGVGRYVSELVSACEPRTIICVTERSDTLQRRMQKRSQQHMSSDNYRNNFRALGPIMNGARIIDEPRPTPKPPITSVTQWTPRYRRVTQMNTMNVSAAAHSR